MDRRISSKDLDSNPMFVGFRERIEGIQKLLDGRVHGYLQ